MAATTLLTLLAHPNAPNLAPVCTITPALPATASNVALAVEGGVLAGILLPSPPRKTRKTSHQQQIDRQNVRKQKAIHNLAHTTSLVAEARANDNNAGDCTGGGRVQGAWVQSCPVKTDMIGTKPLSRGYKGLLLRRAFNLLVLDVELFLQINQVNIVVIERNQIVRLIN